MSIWCSCEVIGADPDSLDPQVGEVRSYVNGWSNHYPTTTGEAEQPAWIDTAYIAPWCVPGVDEDDVDAPQVGPWLRLTVDSPTTEIVNREVVVGARQHAPVVLDETAVRALVESLQRWLDYPKVHPLLNGDPQ